MNNATNWLVKWNVLLIGFKFETIWSDWMNVTDFQFFVIFK